MGAQVRIPCLEPLPLAVAVPALPKQKELLKMFSQEKYIERGNFSTIAVLVVSAYIAAQMLSDIASVKIGIIAKLAVDMGTFIYPITFTLRDVVHKVLGKNNARALIISAGVINLLMALYLRWVASVPGDPAWGLENEFSAVLNPFWRIVIASIVAEVVSELIDTEIYHFFVSKITTRYQWARVLVSNSVSVPADNVIFAIGAFAFSNPWSVVWQIFIFNLLVKFGVTLFSLPLIYIVPETGMPKASQN
jgi:uncharacterized integral membrane protein (TIGR00697 family)